MIDVAGELEDTWPMRTRAKFKDEESKEWPDARHVLRERCSTQERCGNENDDKQTNKNLIMRKFIFRETTLMPC